MGASEAVAGDPVSLGRRSGRSVPAGGGRLFQPPGAAQAGGFRLRAVARADQVFGVAGDPLERADAARWSVRARCRSANMTKMLRLLSAPLPVRRPAAWPKVAS